MGIFDQLVLDLIPIYGEGEAQSVAKIFFEDAFNTKRPNEKEFSAEEQNAYLSLHQRLLDGEPVQYVVGKAMFFGLFFKVTPAVLIPRQETEELVDLALTTLKKMPVASPKVLDIGTGSGCIPIAIKKKFPSAVVSALDISKDALSIAAENALMNGVEVNFFEKNILDETQWVGFTQYDMIISNPPYIPLNEAYLMPDHVKDHEPHLALFVNDGAPLVFYEKISTFAKKHLTPCGVSMYECNEFNANQVEHLLIRKGFEHIKLIKDVSGCDRVVICKKNI